MSKSEQARYDNEFLKKVLKNIPKVGPDNDEWLRREAGSVHANIEATVVGDFDEIDNISPGAEYESGNERLD